MQVPDAIILERQSWNPRGLWRLLFWNERSQLPWLKWVWHREHTKRCIYSSEKSSILKTSLKRIENDLTSQSVSARSKVFVYFDLEIIKLYILNLWEYYLYCHLLIIFSGILLYTKMVGTVIVTYWNYITGYKILRCQTSRNVDLLIEYQEMRSRACSKMNFLANQKFHRTRCF